jgi:hypothetical protein
VAPLMLVYYDEGLANLIHMQAEAGEAATIQFFGVPQPALGTPNFIQIVANAGLTHYQYASFARVYPFIVAADNIVSFPLLRDLQCAFSGERTYTSELHKYKGPVFAIKGGLGFGPYMNDTIKLMQSRNVRVQDTPQFGHLDHLLVPNHADYVERPIVEWLNEVVFATRE